MSHLTIPESPRFDKESIRSDPSVLFGKEYLNSSEGTLKSGMNSSILSKDHYQRLDPHGEYLTSHSVKEVEEEKTEFNIEKDTLDFIDPNDIPADNIKTDKGKDKIIEEIHIQQEGVDQEWQKFLEDAKSEDKDLESGQAYLKLKQPLKALKYFGKAKNAFLKNLSKDDSYSLCDFELEQIDKIEHKYHKLQSYEFFIRKKAKEIEYYLKKKQKRPKISERERKSLIQRANAIYRHDPYNAPLLKVLICWDICQDKHATVASFEEGISKAPHNLNVYIEYWKFLKYLKKANQMMKVSERMMKVVNSPLVPSDQWTEAYDIRFKSLLASGSSEEIITDAVNALEKICFILPPLPLDGLWYIEEAQFGGGLINTSIDRGNNEIQNMIEKTQNCPKQKSPRRWMTLQKTSASSSGVFLSLKDGKCKTPATKEEILSKIRKHFRDNSSSSLNSVDGGIKGFRRNESYDEDAFSESLSSSCFGEYNNILRVTFKSDFLYQIGKTCSKSGFMLDKALKYLNDFLLIINFYKQDMDVKSYRKLRAHAIYYIGITYFQLEDKEYAEKFLREVQIEMREIEGATSKKVKKIDSILSKYFSERFNPAKNCVSEYF